MRTMPGVLCRIRWPLFNKGKPYGPQRILGPKLNLRMMELQEAKEILGEVFGVRSEDVEDMIQRRLEERGRAEENLWPEMFYNR